MFLAAQVARSFAVFQDGVPCDAYVFTSDADLFPLDLAPFIPLPNRAGIGNYMNVYNGDCCWIYTSGRYRGESCGSASCLVVFLFVPFSLFF